MLVGPIERTRVGERLRVAATVQWEDADRPARVLEFEAGAEPEDLLDESADAFAAALLPLAVIHRERRLRVEGSLSARLNAGLRTIIDVYGSWFGADHVVQIEPAGGFVPVRRRAPGATGAFLSGGVDALALLHENRSRHGAGDADAITRCLYVFGLNTYDHDHGVPRPERLAAYEAHARRLGRLCDELDSRLVPVRTNVRTLYERYDDWSLVGFGPGTVAVSLSMSTLLSNVWFASDGVGIVSVPRASAPELIDNLATEAIAIHNGQTRMLRLDKVRRIASWEAGLATLRSCLLLDVPTGDRINCGHCEKCVRTRLEFLAVGALDRLVTMPSHDVTPEELDVLKFVDPLRISFYQQCADALEHRGRRDLVRVMRRKIAEYHRRRDAGAIVRLGGLPVSWARSLLARLSDGHRSR